MWLNKLMGVMQRDPDEAFRDAIANGTFLDDSLLVEDPDVEKWPWHWMYMHSDEQYDYFKNINFRHYIKSARKKD